MHLYLLEEQLADGVLSTCGNLREAFALAGTTQKAVSKAWPEARTAVGRR